MTNQIDQLPPHVAAVARTIVAALRLSPRLGGQASRGTLAEVGARIIKFSEHTRIVDQFTRLKGKLRRGDEDPSAGPPWRIVYVLREARRSELRIVQVLAVGVGHAEQDEMSAYELAETRAEELGLV